MANDWIIDAPFRTLSSNRLAGTAELDPDPGTMPMRNFVEALQDIRTETQDAGVFWRIGAQYDLASLGPGGAAIAFAPTLGQSLAALERAFPLIQSGALMALEIFGSHFEFHYRVLDPTIWPRQGDAELTMGLIFGIVRRFLPQAADMMELRFEHAQDAAGQKLQRDLRCPIVTGENCNALSLPVSALDARATPKYDNLDQAGQDFDTAQSCVDRLVQSSLSGLGITEQCRTAILARIGRKSLDQAEVARNLGLSDRTLRLQLKNAGTSYRHITETCRAEMAAMMLEQTDLPLAEIAWRLGYSEHSAFTRAARRWFGYCPETRRRLF